MQDDDEKIAESKWREEFRQRLIEARGPRTQAVMAHLLGIRTNTYGKYEGGRKSMMPVRLLPRFAQICGKDLVELIEGPRKEKAPAKPKIVKTKVHAAAEKPSRRA
jgi:transcriptional regulator with XRE-family HTH domain